MKHNETIEEIALADIRLDRDTQVRASIDEETIRRYYEIMVDEAARDRFPPVVLFRDKNGRLWLADGHHRIMAALRRGLHSILAIIRDGTKEDAIWEAIKANSRNGLPLGRADIRRAVLMVLEVMPDRSNRLIAESVGCSYEYVRKLRDSTDNKLSVEKTIGRDGKNRPATRKPKPPKPETPPATAPTSAPVAKEPAPSTSTPSPANDATDANTGRVDETPEETNADDRRRIDANVKETQIQATIAQLEREIAEWFEIAPHDMFEAFAKRTRKRIDEVIG